MSQLQQILCPACHNPEFRGTLFCSVCGYDMTLNNAGPAYYITRTIKAGGQGAIYEGIDDRNNVYAIKEMLDNFASAQERDEGIARFAAEARILQRLSHPRIPKVYSAFKDEGRNYLVMDFVQGQDLEAYIKQHGAVPEPQALAWADQICDVLTYLHSQNPPVIFRDIKPSNIMIQPDNTIKLIDFGIAKVLQSAQRGTQIGTPGYAPPEQYQGLATIASDVFALAATLHHLLTGRDPQDQPPFSFPPVRDLQPSVSQRSADAIARGLQMKPEDRFSSIAELRAALIPPAPKPASRPAQGTPPQATVHARPAQPAPLPQQTQAAPRRGLLGYAMVALLLIGIVAIGAFALPIIRSQSSATPQTLIAQPFVAEQMEVIVRVSADQQAIQQAFTSAFTQRAQAQFGASAQVQTNTLTYTFGPQNLGDDGTTTKYRASMRGIILVPQT